MLVFPSQSLSLLIHVGQQPFHFIERPSFRRLCHYLNPKLGESNILKRTAIGDAVADKIEWLDGIDWKLIAVGGLVVAHFRTDKNLLARVSHPGFQSCMMIGHPSDAVPSRQSVSSILIHCRIPLITGLSRVISSPSIGQLVAIPGS